MIAVRVPILVPGIGLEPHLEVQSLLCRPNIPLLAEAVGPRVDSGGSKFELEGRSNFHLLLMYFLKRKTLVDFLEYVISVQPLLVIQFFSQMQTHCSTELQFFLRNRSRGSKVPIKQIYTSGEGLSSTAEFLGSQHGPIQNHRPFFPGNVVLFLEVVSIVWHPGILFLKFDHLRKFLLVFLLGQGGQFPLKIIYQLFCTHVLARCIVYASLNLFLPLFRFIRLLFPDCLNICELRF